MTHECSGDLYRNIPATLQEELSTVVVSNRLLRIERILSTGQSGPEGFWYDQKEHEWVAVLTGKAVLLFDDNTRVTMNAGDYLLIPAHRKHRVEWTLPNEPTVWLAIFFRDEDAAHL